MKAGTSFTAVVRTLLYIWTNIILILATGTCGDEQQSKTGSSLSHILWRNQNAVVRELEDCSIDERFFYSVVSTSGVCNDGKKWIHKEQNITAIGNCTREYILIGGACHKECFLVTKRNSKQGDNNGLTTDPSDESSTHTSLTDVTTSQEISTDGMTDVASTTRSSTTVTGIERNYGKENKVLDCNAGCYGDACQLNCLCENNSTCDKQYGNCTCMDGWTVTYCEKECPKGTFGANCSQTCSCDVTSCHPVDGCICRTQKRHCNRVCPRMTFGAGCTGQCLCLEIGTRECGVLDGSCSCKPGWTGKFCQQLCPKGTFGDGCHQTCECNQNEFCIPINGACLCWDYTTGLNCTTDTNSDTTASPNEGEHDSFLQMTTLHIAILVGSGLLIVMALICTCVAWRRSRSEYELSQYRFNSKDSTLKIVHQDLPPREDLSRYREEMDSNRRTFSSKNKRKSHQDGASRQLEVLNLPTRIKSKPPTTVLGFQDYRPTDEGDLDFDELTRHSYVNLNDEDISKHVEDDRRDYERLNKDEIKPPYQDYEVCVQTDRSYENVPAKKRSLLGSIRKLVRKESRPDSDKAHLAANDMGAGINRSSFITFNKKY
ncbi:uncharacterized protein [Argopecten irradians]|uniref:uncharacterized protein n=1 Tax=Argopecten irradians TaxID=31199 RepID=UPI0037249CCD